MKGFFKKSAISLAVLGFATAASAGTVTGMFLGIDGLDLQARNGDLDFVAINPATEFGTVSTYAIHPSYSWDFRLYGGFTFCGDEDLTVSWLRYHTSYHNDFGTPFVDVTSPASSVLRWFDEDDWGNILAHVTFDLDDVYAVFGHTEHLGPWNIRWAYGVEWFRLNSNMKVTGTIVADESPLQPAGEEFYYEAKDTTRGVGPRVEFDFSYHMPYSFYVFARPNASLLISTRNIELVSNDSTVLDSYEWTHRHVVIPRLGIRLGVGFNWGYGAVGGEGPAGMFDSTLVTIEAGWQAETYIHAVERAEGFENPTINSPSARSNITTKTSNYSNQGFFLGVKLSTNWL